MVPLTDSTGHSVVLRRPRMPRRWRRRCGRSRRCRCVPLPAGHSALLFVPADARPLMCVCSARALCEPCANKLGFTRSCPQVLVISQRNVMLPRSSTAQQHACLNFPTLSVARRCW